MNKYCRTILWALLAMALAMSDMIAQTRPTFQYAVKLVCGNSRGDIIATGVYRTAINIHNPGDTTVVFMAKFARALPGGRPGPVTQWRRMYLGADQAAEIDCADVARWLDTNATFLKGFVVIESSFELDVVAVYTAAGRDGEVRDMEMERVSYRREKPSCPDLVIQSIEKPIWDAANKRSVIHAVVRNIGSAIAGPSIARAIDPTTLQQTGAPYNAIADTPPLAPGATVTVTFYLPYWVYNPDVTLEVTADYRDQVEECNESNNTLVFRDVG